MATIEIAFFDKMPDTLGTIGSRAKLVRKEAGKNQSEIAELLGLAIGTWQKMERDEVVPTGDTLIQFEKLGINPGWVLTGLGPKTLASDPSKAPPPNVAVDPWAMARCWAVSERICREIGRSVTGTQIAEEAAILYSALLGRIVDVRDRPMVEAALAVLGDEAKDRMLKVEPGNGKRSAS